jgi:hypothetical protein
MTARCRASGTMNAKTYSRTSPYTISTRLTDVIEGPLNLIDKNGYPRKNPG